MPQTGTMPVFEGSGYLVTQSRLSAMTKLKTQPTDKAVTGFIDSIDDEQQQADSYWLIGEMTRLTGQPAVMWGDSMVGFGSYHYKYDSGREGDWFMQGFSPRKKNLSVYVLPNVEPYQDYLKKLGPHKLGRSCLYLKNLNSIDRKVLLKLLKQAYANMSKLYPPESST